MTNRITAFKVCSCTCYSVHALMTKDVTALSLCLPVINSCDILYFIKMDTRKRELAKEKKDESTVEKKK